LSYIIVGYSAKEGISLRTAVNRMKEKFQKNSNAQQVVAPEFQYYKKKAESMLKVNLSMVFPSFKIPANYSALLSLIAFVVFGFNIKFLITGGLIWCILMLPDLLQKPFILFYFFKLGLKKNGFKGKLYLVRGKL